MDQSGPGHIALQIIGKRVAARSIEQRLQLCVATNAGSEAVAIDLPKYIDAGAPLFSRIFPLLLRSPLSWTGRLPFRPRARWFVLLAW